MATKRKLNPVFEHDGYLLRFTKLLKDGSSLLYCSERKTIIGCTGSARKSGSTIKMERPHHGHDPNTDLAISKIARYDIREKSSTSVSAPREIIFDAKCKFGVAPISMSGDISNIQRMISRARAQHGTDFQNANKDPPIFTDVMRLTEDSETLLLFDKIVPSSSGRVVCFASPQMLRTLASSDLLLADATFDVVRDPFNQIWILHGKITHEYTVPLAFILMERRTKADYVFVLQELKRLPEMVGWNPTDFVGDLEHAEQKAVVEVFSQIKQHYCYFHVIQGWRRKLENLKIYKQTENGQELYEFWSCLKCLPFVPVNEVESTFRELVGTLVKPLTQEQQSFISYMEMYYVGPRPVIPFAPELWNVVDSTLQSLPRTSNTVEASHRNLEKCVRWCNGRRSVLISDLIKCIKLEEKMFRFDVEALNLNPLHKIHHHRKTKDVRKDARIMKVVLNSPPPPSMPLTGVQYLKAVRAAKKYQ